MCFIGALALATFDQTLLLEFQICKLGGLQLSLNLILDIASAIFLFTVLLITGVVILFSGAYMLAEVFFWRFHALVLLFVVSICILIIRPNLVSVLLGWDGLGVRSYLLVIFFQRSKSYNAGIVTALSNRVGDVLILLRISLMR